MTRYNEQPFHQRLGQMGDMAEGKFEELAPLGRFVRFGFNRPPFRMAKLSSFIRHSPDYVTAAGHLVEVMGCGRDGVLKLKVEKYEALKEWARHGHLVLFVWNSAEQDHRLLSWHDVKAEVRKARPHVTAFTDGNEYYPIPWNGMR